MAMAKPVGKRRSRTTRVQHDIFLNFLLRNEGFRLERVDPNNPQYMEDKWNELTNLLNETKPVRSMHEWRMVLTNWKYIVRSRGSRAYHVSGRHKNPNGPPFVRPKLSEIEKKAWCIWKMGQVTPDTTKDESNDDVGDDEVDDDDDDDDEEGFIDHPMDVVKVEEDSIQEHEVFANNEWNSFIQAGADQSRYERAHTNNQSLNYSSSLHDNPAKRRRKEYTKSGDSQTGEVSNLQDVLLTLAESNAMNTQAMTRMAIAMEKIANAFEVLANNFSLKK